MRKAPSIKAYRNPDTGLFFGLVLEADYVGQHEHGVEGMQRSLGIHLQGVGMPARSMTGPLKEPNHLLVASNMLQSGSTVDYIEFNHFASENREHVGRCIESMEAPVGQDGASAEWNGNGFRIAAYDDEMKAAVATIAESIRSGDFAAYNGGFDENPFARGNLALLIPSRTPSFVAEAAMQHDVESKRLTDAAEATGIAQRLKKADEDEFGIAGMLKTHSYYALSPDWKDGQARNGVTLKSDHPVVFFLNPFHQDRFEADWFTVEELDAWIAGEGPVLKTTLAPVR